MNRAVVPYTRIGKGQYISDQYSVRNIEAMQRDLNEKLLYLNETIQDVNNQ